MKRSTRAGGAIATVCLLATAACSSEGDDTTSESAATDAPTTGLEEASEEAATTEPLETTPTTAAPTTVPTVTEPPETTEPEPVEPPATAATVDSTIEPSGDTVLVRFHIVDTSFPDGWTCDDAIPGFDVAFTDESGERTNVEARFPSDFRLATADPNGECAIELFDGEPALFLTANLDAPTAETYQTIETRYPFAYGAGSDTYNRYYEMVTSEEAEAGLYYQIVGEGTQVVGEVALDPSEAADLPFPVVE